MYAIFETGGKQYRVKEGDQITVEKLKVSEGKQVKFENVLVMGDGKEAKVGTPYINAAAVFGEVLTNGKGNKVIIFKYKAKKDYRRKQGHRQPFSLIEITGISPDGKAPVKKAKPKQEAPAKAPTKAVEEKKETKPKAKPKAEAAATKEKAKPKAAPTKTKEESKPKAAAPKPKTEPKSKAEPKPKAEKAAPKAKEEPKPKIEKAAPKAEPKTKPKAEAAKTNKAPSLKSMKKAELIALAKEKGIKIDEKATIAVLIETIEKALK